jgi:short-subunit dehydrogenase
MSKLVFITGASSGIGQALALRYHQAGYSLALVARRVNEIETWAKAHAISETSYKIYSADVAVADSIVAAGHACVSQQGVPEIVIANAGISLGVDTAFREDIDAMASIFATNTIGVAATFQPFIAAMTARGHGKLVGMASVAGIRGLPGHGGYCASKAALISYCESLRGEMRATGVQVVTLCPGYIDTPLTQKNKYPMPFLMKPEAFADQAFSAIEGGSSYRVIPWQMGWVAKLLRLLPNALFDKLFAGQPRKHRSASL